jgi:hypothetical protein
MVRRHSERYLHVANHRHLSNPTALPYFQPLRDPLSRWKVTDRVPHAIHTMPHATPRLDVCRPAEGLENVYGMCSTACAVCVDIHESKALRFSRAVLDDESELIPAASGTTRLGLSRNREAGSGSQNNHQQRMLHSLHLSQRALSGDCIYSTHITPVSVSRPGPHERAYGVM